MVLALRSAIALMRENGAEPGSIRLTVSLFKKLRAHPNADAILEFRDPVDGHVGGTWFDGVRLDIIPEPEPEGV